MRRILIPTMVGDTHARAVCCAASARGYDVVRWFTADQPTRQLSTFLLTNDGRMSWALEGSELSLHDDSFDVVWLRRPMLPLLPPTLHPHDVHTASVENLSMQRSILYSLADGAAWINPYEAHLRARNKLVQLRAAGPAGLTIPATLMSNDPARVRTFITANLPRRTIYKPFQFARWESDDGAVAVVETTIIDQDSLPSPDLMRLTPGIFQPYIEKAFEVRATFFGAHVIALKLHSQKSECSKVDWRASANRGLEVETCTLPEEVYQACRRLMRALGLVFGAFDFVVTPTGEYVFLEVNEAGQFLWKEHLCPQTRVLDVFLDFLANPSYDFSWEPSSSRHQSLVSIVTSDEYQRLGEDERALHVAGYECPIDLTGPA
jgi:hypothetical protein